MSFRRTDGSDQPADRVEADRLLDAAAAGPGADPGVAGDPLARLLCAAAAPARPGELAGEEAALAAFRAAPAAPAPARSPNRRRLTTGAVAWIAGVAATATAGAAFAAVKLDRPEEPAPSSGPSAPPSAPAGPGSGSASASTGVDTPTDRTPTDGTPTAPITAPAPPTGDPTPSGKDAAQLPGLCRAYLARPADQRASELEKPGYGPLVTAAGGPEKVADYCQRLVADNDRDKKSPDAPRSAKNPVDGTDSVGSDTGTAG
jgi:hypothetical protein